MFEEMGIGVRAYRALGRIGRRRRVCVAAIFVFTIAFRLALGVVLPHPQPASHDEFAYLLGADLFAHGEIAGAPHLLWKFFESVQVISWPVHVPKYPPGQSAFLALGEILGDPFYGVLFSVALFAAAICWMLQAFVAPAWALLGGICAALYFGAGHYWTEMFWGGAVAGLGAALLIGSFGRLVNGRSAHFGWLFGAGALLAMNSRPYESSLLIAAMSVALIVKCKWSRLAPTVIACAAAILITAGYNARVTGNPLKMPYLLYMEQYADAPQFWFQPLPAPKHFDNAALEWSAQRYDVGSYNEIRAHSIAGRFLENFATVFGTILYDGGALSLAPLIFIPWFWRDRTIRLGTLLAAALLAAIGLEVVVYLHYLAPLIVVGTLLSWRILDRLWQFKKTRSADRVAMACALSLMLLAGPVWRAARAMEGKTGQLYRGGDFGFERKRIVDEILAHPGKHVVFVRFNAAQSPQAAWVANGANIDAQRLIWAHDRGAENRELETYFAGRSFWLLEDHGDHVSLQPYRDASPAAEAEPPKYRAGS